MQRLESENQITIEIFLVYGCKGFDPSGKDTSSVFGLCKKTIRRNVDHNILELRTYQFSGFLHVPCPSIWAGGQAFPQLLTVNTP